MSISKDQAIGLISLIPDGSPSSDLCSEINPELWSFWCEVRGRSKEGSNVWAEVDVVNSCILLINNYLQECLRDI